MEGDAAEREVERALASLRAERDAWEELLAPLGEAELAAPRTSKGWSLRDMVAHLKAWQDVSNARVGAAITGDAPRMPRWSGGEDPDDDERIDAYNDAIYEENRASSWERVHAEWREGFDRLLRRAAEVPPAAMVAPGRFEWLGDHPLIAVLRGSEAHHREHRERLFGPGS